MTHTNSKVVRIESVQKKQPLSKGQVQFNSLIKKIEKLKKKLLEWQDVVPRLHQRVGSEYRELIDTFNDRRIKFVYLLDKAHDDKLFKRRDKDKIAHLICTITAELVAEDGDDEDLKALHDKYSDVSLDEQSRETDDMMKSMVEEMLGVEVGDDEDLSSPEKLKAFMDKMMEEEHAQERERQRQADERRASRKKTSKQIEKEARLQAEELNIKKSLQEVYRKLVAALHPDRERDSAERERKTELMQRVNVAYDKKDLLQLLELQLEVEQIDQLRINAISDERVKHYNKILKEQADELQQEIDEMQTPFKMQFQLPPWAQLSPADVLSRLNLDIKDLKRNIASMEHDLQTFKDRNALKAWLKGYQIPRQPDLDDLDDMMLNGMMPPFGRR